MADHEGDVHVVGVGQAGVVVAGAEDGVPQASPVCVQQGFHHEVVEQVEPAHSGWFARTGQGVADLVTVQSVADLVTVQGWLLCQVWLIWLQCKAWLTWLLCKAWPTWLLCKVGYCARCG